MAQSVLGETSTLRLSDAFALLWTRAATWRGGRAHAAMCAIVVGFAASWLAPLMVRGWIPHDEGTIAQSAHRILIGEIPHRDFDEVYTGGLSFLHAAAFRVLGESLISLRMVLFSMMLLVVPVLYYIASRFAPAVVAGLVSIAAIVWSFPVYPASMPSWYNLAFAVFGAAALLRYVETDRRVWIFAAGLSGGLSVTVKIIGVYFIAGAALFLIFHAAASSRPTSASRSSKHFGTALAIAAVVVLGLGPLAIMRGGLQANDFIQLAIPVLLVAVAIAIEVWRTRKRTGGLAVEDIVSIAWPFALGVLVPIGLFVAMYAYWDGLAWLYRGVLVLPQKRLQWATTTSPSIRGFVIATPMLILILSRWFSDAKLHRVTFFGLLAIQLAVVLACALSYRGMLFVWVSVRATVPIAIAAGLALVTFFGEELAAARHRREQLLVLLSTVAWCAVVQFPMGAPVYFVYILPLVVLSVFAVAAVRGTISPRVGVALLLSYTVVGSMLRSHFFAPGSRQTVVNSREAVRLDLPRGGLLVRGNDRDEYTNVARAVQAHSTSRYIYVTPDAPEVYFLTSRENPTRTLFDFFDEPQDRDNRILGAIRSHGVNVVVINKRPEFSGTIPPTLRDSLIARFPRSEDVGKFEVRWGT